MLSVKRSLVRVVDRALPQSLFSRLRSRVVALGAERMRSTYQTTFWFDFAEPSNLVERAVLELREQVPQRGVVGVEWWLSRMRTRNVKVDFHKDRDNALADTTGELVHPRMSSVLFLNKVEGGLLAITAENPNPRNTSFAPDRLDTLDVVAPSPNRFAIFRGDLTHGVLDEHNRVPSARGRTGGELRLAVIVNWWGRRPLAVPTFGERKIYGALR